MYRKDEEIPVKKEVIIENWIENYGKSNDLVDRFQKFIRDYKYKF